MKYIAKPGTWFDEGTEAFMVGEPWECYDDAALTQHNLGALFCGSKDGKLDEEVCTLDEFEITGK